MQNRDPLAIPGQSGLGEYLETKAIQSKAGARA